MRYVLLCALWATYCITSVRAGTPGDGTYEKRPDGIIVHIAHPLPLYPHTLSLQAITPRIIHVIAFPGDGTTPPLSLMRVADPQPTARYEVLEQDSTILFSTDSLKVRVSLTTGKVTFMDNEGKVLLAEAPRDQPPFGADTAQSGVTGGAASGAGAAVSGADAAGERHAWKVSATFYSPPGESLYGLGQQQNGFLDYKGRSVTLLQQNSSVAIPMVMSSRNYGLLWDNYSITRFGDLRPYQPISCLELHGEDGAPGGLTATYGTEATVFLRRSESQINYKYLADLAKLPQGYSLQNGLVRWKGTLRSAGGGLYQFLLYAGGYVRVWVDGKLVADRWRQCWNPETIPFDIHFDRDRDVPITLEWKPDGSESFISLSCLPPGPDLYKDTYSLTSEVGDAVNYYFIKGDNLDQVISGYRLLTGKAPMMPLWAMGLWQSRERYKTQEELLSTVSEFREQRIPLDNIVLDWQYWRPDQWGSQEFDRSRFPHPDAMLKGLHDTLHAHFMISVWPKFYTGTQNYLLFRDKGWLYTRNVDIGQKDWLGYVSTFYDAFNEDARHNFWKLIDQKLFSLGVDGWWMDATEPDIQSNTTIAERKALMEPHALGTAARYFNAFPLENARAVYEGQRAASDNRVFILTRSAFAGQQRYSAATWSGDIGARWEDMRNQITAGLNFSLSGLPYWTMDIGGFAVERRYEHPGQADLEEWRELNTRWFQFGAFCPLLRVHGQFPYREVFHIAPPGDPAYQSIVYYDCLRYRLLPYIYSMAGRVWYDNYTPMRALVLDFGVDSQAREVSDEFMYGPSLLVNPVYTYKARSRSVYLPSGADWYDAYSGALTHGGQRIVADAPYERIPLYVRSGSIVPLGPNLQYTGERPADTVTLYVYTGANASFTLYEDGDTNYQYEKGAYATIPMTWDETTRTLTIGERKGNFPGMLGTRTFRIVWISAARARALGSPEADATTGYSGNTIQIKPPF